MKKTTIILVVMTLVMSCKQKEKDAFIEQDVKSVAKREYPASITKVFEAHGGLDAWNSMQSLTFSMDRGNGKREITTTNLKSRASLIDAPNYMLGNTGSNLWVKSKDTSAYKGNAKFYNGLMFYFHTMPFIVADAGITYTAAEPLEFEGQTYPGVLVSYNAGVGVSPDDQYIIYYDSETNKMAWLGYTVTFGSNQKSTDFSYIRYNNWKTINGIELPISIDLYSDKDNVIGDKRSTIEFLDVTVSTNAPEPSLFALPEGATIVKD